MDRVGGLRGIGLNTQLERINAVDNAPKEASLEEIAKDVLPSDGERAEPPQQLRVIDQVEITGVNKKQRQISYKIHIRNEGAVEETLYFADFAHWVSYDAARSAQDGFQMSDRFSIRHEGVTTNLNDLARIHLGLVRGDNERWQPGSLEEPMAAAPKIRKIAQVDITNISGDGHVTYTTVVSSGQPIEGTMPAGDFLLWLTTYTDRPSANTDYAFDEGYQLTDAGTRTTVEALANRLSVVQVGDRWYKKIDCPTEVIAERDSNTLYLLIGDTKVGVKSDEYVAFIAGSNHRANQLFVGDACYVVPRNLQVRGHGSHKSVPLPLTWEGLQQIDLPVRLTEAIIEVRDGNRGIPAIYLNNIALNPASQWKETIASLRQGIAFLVDGALLYVDDTLRIVNGNQLLSLEAIDTAEKAQVVFGLKPTQFALVTPIKRNQATIFGTDSDAIVVRYGKQQVRVTKDGFAMPIQIGENWYRLPKTDGFALPEGVRLLGDSANTFDDLHQIASLIQPGQPGAIYSVDGTYRFFRQVTGVQLHTVKQDGTITLDLQWGGDNVAQLDLTPSAYGHLLDQAEGYQGIRGDFFFPSGLLQPLKDLIAEWGKEEASPRVLSKVVLQPSRRYGQSVLALYSGDILWGNFTLSSRVESGILGQVGGAWNRFSSGPKNSKVHYELDRTSAKLHAISESGEEVVAEWPESGNTDGVRAFVNTYTCARGTEARPAVVKGVALNADGTAAITVEIDQYRGTQEHQPVDQQLSVDTARLLQHQVVDQKLKIGNIWVVVPADLAVPLERAEWRGKRAEIVVAPEEAGAIRLTFMTNDGSTTIQLADEELANFKLAMQQGRAFPIKVGRAIVNVSGGQLKPMLGRDDALPRLVKEAAFTCQPNGHSEAWYTFEPQQPIADGCDPIGPSDGSSTMPVSNLVNWLDGPGDSKFTVGEHTYYELLEDCQTKVALPSGRVVRFTWNNRMERSQAAEAIRDELTTQYKEQSTVCVVRQRPNSTTLMINKRSYFIIPDADFAAAIEANCAYTIEFLGQPKPITIYPAALYAQLGSIADDPFKVTRIEIIAVDGVVQLRYQYLAVVNPVIYSVKKMRTGELQIGVATLIQRYTDGDLTFRAHGAFFSLKDDCEIRYQNNDYQCMTNEGRERLLEELRALTSTPTSVNFFLNQATERAVPMTINERGTVYRIDLAAELYARMREELAAGRPYTVDAGEKAFTFTQEHVNQAPPPNVNHTMAQENAFLEGPER